jgi:hypothetical protein
MSLPTSSSMEAALGSILSDHFDTSHNPHETLYRIWLLLNAGLLSNPDVAVVVREIDGLKVGKPTYN